MCFVVYPYCTYALFSYGLWVVHVLYACILCMCVRLCVNVSYAFFLDPSVSCVESVCVVRMRFMHQFCSYVCFYACILCMCIFVSIRVLYAFFLRVCCVRYECVCVICCVYVLCMCSVYVYVLCMCSVYATYVLCMCCMHIYFVHVCFWVRKWFNASLGAMCSVHCECVCVFVVHLLY